MQLSLITPRLSIDPISLNDFEFIQKLLNTPGWIQFIGDRNVHSEEAAQNYLRKILDNQNINYWIVRLRQGGVPIGIVTFMIRNYLDDYDFGFAFLPEHGKHGYAFEAASEVMKELKKDPAFKQILGITLPDNVSSINLLERLGFVFEKNILIDNEELKLFIK